MSFIVTKEWIIENTTKQKGSGSAINAPQAKILGFEWIDLKGGWRDKTIGLKISNARKILFESLNGIKGKKSQNIVIDDFKRKIK